MNKVVKWVAELPHVREVSLSGGADLAYWKDRLRRADVLAAEADGRAQILIIGSDARFAGVWFRELSFSVLLSQPGAGSWKDAAFLEQAFNSCWLFALCERVFFSTPSCHGAVRLRGFPPSIELIEGGRTVFQAQMRGAASAPDREPTRYGVETWAGPVFLPAPRRREPTQAHLFFARIKGYTKRYPFLHSKDSLNIEPSPGSPVLRALRDSNFVPTEWILREDALHAKSKTYKEEPSGQQGPVE